MTSENLEMREDLSRVELSPRLIHAAQNAVLTCLSGTSDDRAVVIFDSSTAPVAAALLKVLDENEIPISLVDLDRFGARPLVKLPASFLAELQEATISAFAAKSMRGELSVRKNVLEIVTSSKVRHAHMPSITPEVFADGLSMDYREVSRFMKILMGEIEASSSLTMTSKAGTDLRFDYTSPPVVDLLDGLIDQGRWQNLPSGQIIIYPTNAEGRFVTDRNIGDWFEHKYDIPATPVTFEFEKGQVRSISCDNKRLERDLWLFIRSSDNSGRISELVIGANLGLTQNHPNALYDGYRPGASISLGAFEYNPKVSWHSATVLPMMSKANGIRVGDRILMTGDVFCEEVLEQAKEPAGRPPDR